MRLFGLNITRHTTPPVTKADGELPLSDLSLRWLRGEDIQPGPLLTNAYQQSVWVYRAIGVLAEQIANIPFLFSAGERGRENLITSGPLHEFYDRPHPHIDRFQYWELRLLWLMLRGESFRVPVYGIGRNGRRALKSILILDPDRFQHVIEDNRLIGWRYTGLGHDAPLHSQVLLPEEVWFERLPNPFDFWRGMSPLSVAALPAQTDYAAGSFMKGLMENNADLGVIVRCNPPLEEKQREQIKAALQGRKRRAGTADQPLLLWSGAEVIKPLLSSADLQFLENRKFSRAEICAAFGVPEEIITATDHAKYDVMAGARLNFIENRVAPLCARLEAAENSTTIPALSTSVVGWFDIDSLPILQEARRTRLESAKAGFDMGIPFNELNRVLDLGFKPLPWGDDGYISTRFQRLSRTGVPPVPNPRFNASTLPRFHASTL